MKIRKRILIAVMMMCLAIMAMSCVSRSKSEDSEHPTFERSAMYVDFIDVGKGDCILIRSGGTTFLIDTGYKNTSDTVVDYLKTQGITSLDGMIITHFDKDHVGGARDILKNFSVSKVYMPKYEDTGNRYAEFKEYVDENVPNIITYVTEDVTIHTGGMEILINPGNEISYKQENDYSLVTKITHGEDTYLFAGDAEKKRIKELLKEEFLSADVLKLPHHGGAEDNSMDFLDAVSPKYVLSTSLTEEDTDVTIKDKLSEMNAQIFYTCNGSVTCVSDGNRNYEFK